MFSYIWPVGLVVLSNVVYQICTKSVPGGMNPFASLAITYSVGAVCSVALFFLSGKGGDLFGELAKTNWAPFVLGLAIVGLEVGFILAYQAGWAISTLSLVQSVVLAVALIFVGWLGYREQLSWNILLGIGICMVGLYFINMKK